MGTTSTKSKCNTNTNLNAQTVLRRAKKSYALPLLGMVQLTNKNTTVLLKTIKMGPAQF